MEKILFLRYFAWLKIFRVEIKLHYFIIYLNSSLNKLEFSLIDMLLLLLSQIILLRRPRVFSRSPTHCIQIADTVDREQHVPEWIKFMVSYSQNS